MLKADTVISFDPAAPGEKDGDHNATGRAVEDACAMCGSETDFPEHLEAGFAAHPSTSAITSAHGRTSASTGCPRRKEDRCHRGVQVPGWRRSRLGASRAAGGAGPSPPPARLGRAGANREYVSARSKVDDYVEKNAVRI